VWQRLRRHRGGVSGEPVVVDRAEGPWLYDVDGNRYLDGVSSLWVTTFGHRTHEIDAAIRAQLERLDHATFLGATHVPGIELAERLLATAPGRTLPPSDPDQPGGPSPTDPEGPTDPKPTEPTHPTGPAEPPPPGPPSTVLHRG